MRTSHLLIGASLALGFAAAPLAAAHAQSTAPAPEPRFHQLTLDEMNPEQKRVAAIAMTSPAGIGGPFNIVFRDPKLAEIFLELGNRVVRDSPLPKDLKELATIVSARALNTQQIWALHAPAALKAGLPAALVEDIRHGRRPAVMTDDQAIIFDYCVEAFRDDAVSDATYARAKARFGEEAIVNLAGLLGFEGLVTAVVKTAAIPIPGTSADNGLVAVKEVFPRP